MWTPNYSRDLFEYAMHLDLTACAEAQMYDLRQVPVRRYFFERKGQEPKTGEVLVLDLEK